jgi:hypothetical protein
VKGFTPSAWKNDIEVDLRISNTGSAPGQGQGYGRFGYVTVACLAPEVDGFVAILKKCQDSLDIDGNPQAGLGKRIFPDRLTPADGLARSTVIVRVRVLPSSATNCVVWFRSFDLDDPSQNYDGGTNEVDSNDTATLHKGSDNRGTPQVGTFAPDSRRSGSIVMEVDGQTVCVGMIDFSVTLQAGDNFRIGTSFNPEYLDNVTIDEGTGQGLSLVADASIVKTTDMLTVWRRLHIERDEMDGVSGVNSIETQIAALELKQGFSPSTRVFTLTANLTEGDQSPNRDSQEPGDGRFEHGIVSFPSSDPQIDSQAIGCNGDVWIGPSYGSDFLLCFHLTKADNSDPVDGSVDACSTTGGQSTIGIHNGALESDAYIGGQLKLGAAVYTIVSNTTDQLVTSEAVLVACLLTDDDSLVQPAVADLGLVSGDVAETNLFWDAYISPVLDGGGGNFNDDNVLFAFNVPANSDSRSSLVLDHFGSRTSGNQQDGYWIVYILSAFQSATNMDIDAAGEAVVECGMALTLGIGDNPDHGAFWNAGSIVFMECVRDAMDDWGFSSEDASLWLRQTIAHEFGHQFGCEHSDDGIMGNYAQGQEPNAGLRFSLPTIERLRSCVKGPGVNPSPPPP